MRQVTRLSRPLPRRVGFRRSRRVSHLRSGWHLPWIPASSPREQNRLLGELSGIPLHSQCERSPSARRGLPPRRRVAPGGAHQPRLPHGAAHRGPGPPGGLGARAPRCPAAPRCSSTATTTSSRPIRSTSGSRPPFEPTVRDGRLYARGAADDKGQVFCLLKAYEATLDARAPAAAQRPLHLRGRGGVRRARDRRPAAGGARAHPRGRRAGLRHVVLCARVARRLHRAPGPLLRRDLGPDARARPPLRHATAGSRPTRSRRSCGSWPGSRTPIGEIQIPKLYKAVEPPTKQELKAWKHLPFDKEAFLREEVTGQALTGLKEYSVFERVWALPTFEIHGIKGGFVGRRGQDRDPGAGHGQGEPAAGAGPGATPRWDGSSSARSRPWRPRWADVKVTLLHGGDPVRVDVTTRHSPCWTRRSRR